MPNSSNRKTHRAPRRAKQKSPHHHPNDSETATSTPPAPTADDTTVPPAAQTVAAVTQPSNPPTSDIGELQGAAICAQIAARPDSTTPASPTLLPNSPKIVPQTVPDNKAEKLDSDALEHLQADYSTEFTKLKTKLCASVTEFKTMKNNLCASIRAEVINDVEKHIAEDHEQLLQECSCTCHAQAKITELAGNLQIGLRENQKDCERHMEKEIARLECRLDQETECLERSADSQCGHLDYKIEEVKNEIQSDVLQLELLEADFRTAVEKQKTTLCELTDSHCNDIMDLAMNVSQQICNLGDEIQDELKSDHVKPDKIPALPSELLRRITSLERTVCDQQTTIPTMTHVTVAIVPTFLVLVVLVTVVPVVLAALTTAVVMVLVALVALVIQAVLVVMALVVMMMTPMTRRSTAPFLVPIPSAVTLL